MDEIVYKGFKWPGGGVCSLLQLVVEGRLLMTDVGSPIPSWYRDSYRFIEEWGCISTYFDYYNPWPSLVIVESSPCFVCIESRTGDIGSIQHLGLDNARQYEQITRWF